LDSPAGYINWAFISISVPNLIVIGGMVLVFALALILPFPHSTSTKSSKR